MLKRLGSLFRDMAKSLFVDRWKSVRLRTRCNFLDWTTFVPIILWIVLVLTIMRSVTPHELHIVTKTLVTMLLISSLWLVTKLSTRWDEWARVARQELRSAWVLHEHLADRLRPDKVQWPFRGRVLNDPKISESAGSMLFVLLVRGDNCYRKGESSGELLDLLGIDGRDISPLQKYYLQITLNELVGQHWIESRVSKRGDAVFYPCNRAWDVFLAHHPIPKGWSPEDANRQVVPSPSPA